MILTLQPALGADYPLCAIRTGNLVPAREEQPLEGQQGSASVSLGFVPSVREGRLVLSIYDLLSSGHICPLLSLKLHFLVSASQATWRTMDFSNMLFFLFQPLYVLSLVSSLVNHKASLASLSSLLDCGLSGLYFLSYCLVLAK